MTHATLQHSQLHPHDEVPTPANWFTNLAKLSQWKEKEIFKGKTLLLPCDDYEWSGFAKYFIPRFKELGIAKLICRNYNPDLASRKTMFRDDIIPHTAYSFGCLTNIPDFFPLRRAVPKKPERKTEDDFKRYDNFNAIHLSSLWCLPEHCGEVMGVPATFFEYDYKGKYEIVGRAATPCINGKKKYSRILIKEK